MLQNIIKEYAGTLQEGWVSANLDIEIKPIKNGEVTNAIRELMASELDAITVYTKFIKQLKLGSNDENRKQFEKAIKVVAEIRSDEKQHFGDLNLLMQIFDEDWKNDLFKEKDEVEEKLHGKEVESPKNNLASLLSALGKKE
jgi:rubrerythrin